MAVCSFGWDWAQANFWLDLVIVVSTGPFAYLTWASGTFAALIDAARGKGRWPRKRWWRRKVDPADEWRRRFPERGP